MSIVHCRCDRCIIAAVERIEELTAYAIDLESMVRVANHLLDQGEHEAARGVIIHAASIVHARDLTGGACAERMQQAVADAAAVRAAGRLR